jgi:hypothetical protein
MLPIYYLLFVGFQFSVNFDDYEVVLRRTPSFSDIQKLIIDNAEDRRGENGLHSLVKEVSGPRTTAHYAKFRSLSSRVLDVWFDDGNSGSAQGTIRPGHETTTNAYLGHVFFFTVHGDKSKEIARITIRADQVTYTRICMCMYECMNV